MLGDQTQVLLKEQTVPLNAAISIASTSMFPLGSL